MNPSQFEGVEWQNFPYHPRHSITKEQYKMLADKLDNTLQRQRDKLYFHYNAILVKPLRSGHAGDDAGRPRDEKVLQHYYKAVLTVVVRIMCHCHGHLKERTGLLRLWGSEL